MKNPILRIFMYFQIDCIELGFKTRYEKNKNQQK